MPAYSHLTFNSNITLWQIKNIHIKAILFYDFFTRCSTTMPCWWCILVRLCCVASESQIHVMVYIRFGINSFSNHFDIVRNKFISLPLKDLFPVLETWPPLPFSAAWDNVFGLLLLIWSKPGAFLGLRVSIASSNFWNFILNCQQPFQQPAMNGRHYWWYSA